MVLKGGKTNTPLRQDKRTGFTIVELLIVVVVIAILAAITVVAYNGIRQSADTSARKADLSQLQRKIQTDVLRDTGATISIQTPIARLTGVGSVPLTTPLVNTQELTLYGVFDTANNPAPAGWSAMVSFYPNTTTNSIRLRTGASNDNTMRGFHATVPQQNRDLTTSNILNTTARHIGWISANSTHIYSSYDNASTLSATLTAHGGWNFDSLATHTNPAFSVVSALAFPEYHDPATRAQIIQWLNKEYNVGL